MKRKKHKSEPVSKAGTPVPGYTPELGTRIAEAIELAGGLRTAANLIGVSEDSLAQWRDGKARPSFFGLRELTSEAGKSMDWLADGAPAARVQNDAEFVGIPRYDARLAAGAGAFNERAQHLDDIPFTREFLQRKLGRNTAEGLAVLEARGDSMEPTIGDGDLVLVDRRQDEPEDGIMAFVLDDTAYVKRIRNIPDGIEVISDNRVYEPYRLDQARFEALQIIGRVRWIGRVLGR